MDYCLFRYFWYEFYRNDIKDFLTICYTPVRTGSKGEVTYWGLWRTCYYYPNANATAEGCESIFDDKADPDNVKTRNDNGMFDMNILQLIENGKLIE